MTDTNEIEICKASDWGPWGDCTKTCGGGVQYSNRFPLSEGYTEYDCGSLTQSRVCNENLCPTSVVTFFKFIDYKHKKYKGWTEEEVIEACEANYNIAKTADSIVLYHDYDAELTTGTFLNPDVTSDSFFDFNVSTTGEYVYANGIFLKIKNRQIVDVYECEYSEDEFEIKTEEWCGSNFTKDSFICLTGTNELTGTLNAPLSDRYYYSQTEASFKSKWMSRNNLLTITYLTANDSRNKIIKQNLWALMETEQILYYSIDYDESAVCPPQNGTWIPILPMQSHNVSLQSSCSETVTQRLSCDLKDAYNEKWFDLENQSEYVNTFEKDLVNNTDSLVMRNDFYQVLSRGGGQPAQQSNVFSQNTNGLFNINKLSTNPPGVGVTNYFSFGELGGDIMHKIEFPLNKPIDLVKVKIMTIMNIPGNFDLQAYSLKTQQWNLLKKVNHFENNQQIVTESVNDSYNRLNPPLDGTDTIIESVIAVRIFVGEYDYDTDTPNATEFTSNQQGIMVHSLRVEGRDVEPCNASQINYLTEREIYQVVAKESNEKPKFYEGNTEIVGDPCVGNILYGNYKYEGNVDEIIFTWAINDSLVGNSRHLNTSGLNIGDVLKFSVTFQFNQTETKTFESFVTLLKCKTRIYPQHDNSADFTYVSRTSSEEGDNLIGYDWPDVACIANETNIIKLYWTGNLQIGKKVSTDIAFATTETVIAGMQYFVCKEENCVIKLDKNMNIAEIVSCPPMNFELITEKSFALISNSEQNTKIGTFEATPVNKNIKYYMNDNSFGIHNSLFTVTNVDTVNNLQNVDLLLTGDISQIGGIAKISVYAKSSSNVGYVVKDMSININQRELTRYTDCPQISISGFNTDLLNGVYGLDYSNTTSESTEVGYVYHDKKLFYKTERKYSSGFLLNDGTVEFGSGYFYTELKWSTDQNRWELYVVSDDGIDDTEYNETYKTGKLCAYSTDYSNDCPVGLNFTGISESFGTGASIESGLILYGDNFSS